MRLGSHPPQCFLGALDEWGHLDVEQLTSLPYGVYSCVFTTKTHCLGWGDESNLTLEGRREICKILKLSHPVGSPCCRPYEAGARLLGLSIGPVYVNSKCLCNTHNCLCNRHGKAQTVGVEPARGVEWAANFKRRLAESYSRHLEHWLVEWIKKWPVKKREAFALSDIVDPVLPSRVKLLVKRELLGVLKKKARGIQMYHNLTTQALFAAHFTALQKALSECFDGTETFLGIDVTMASGLNSVGLAAWMEQRQNSRSFYERDGINWDANAGEQLYGAKRKVFDFLEPAFLKFMDQCVSVKGGCRIKGLWNCFCSYTLKAGVKSGHNDTTLGNSLMNALVAVHALLENGYRGSVIVAGDDLLVASPDDVDVDLMTVSEAKCGVDPEARVFTDPYDTSFISGIWAPVEGGLTFVPKPGRLMQRLFWTVKDVSVRRRQAWRHAVCSSLLPATGCIPVISDFLRVNDVATRGRVPDRLLPRYALMMGGSPVRVANESTVQWFVDRYGFDPALLSGCFNTPYDRALVVHPLLELMMAIDSADVKDRALTGAGGPVARL